MTAIVVLPVPEPVHDHAVLCHVQAEQLQQEQAVTMQELLQQVDEAQQASAQWREQAALLSSQLESAKLDAAYLRMRQQMTKTKPSLVSEQAFSISCS